MPSKVLFIGLDAADPELIMQWSQQGHLPNLSELMANGTWGWTENPLGLYVGAVWPSFSTSVSPARHTRYCFTQLIPGQYDNKPFRAEEDLKSEPFWKYLGEKGKRVAVIDIPKVGLGSINGIQIADWGTHDPEYAEMRCWPENLAAEITEKFGINPVPDCNGTRHSAKDYSDFRDMLVNRTRHKQEMISHFLATENWDCMIASFSEGHCAGHQCWHFNDVTHPRHDAGVAEACGNPMLDVYRALDDAVGRLIEQAGSNTMVTVLASHGMGPHYEATYLLEAILERLEKARYRVRGSVVRSGLKRLWSMLPQDLKKRWQSVRTAAISAGLSPLSARHYFKIPNNDVFGGVRINLAGRESHGRVQPGQEFDQVCDDLTEDLYTLTNAESGEKLVTRVIRTRQHYQGEHLDFLPDLMIEWNRSAPINIVHSPLIGEIRGDYEGCRTGDHKAQGLFMGTGPGITPGKRKTPVSVMDFGPTIARQAGIDLPDIDGKPIDTMIKVT